MSSVIGEHFKVATWGESHGPAVGAVVDGCPSNLKLTREEVQVELDKRRPGQSKVTTSRGEADEVEFLSGVFEERTLGTPLSMIVYNRDVDSSKYEALKDTPRPNHADLSYRLKYGHVDWRGGGRASARETVGRVAAGAVAGRILGEVGVEVYAYTKSVGSIESGETLESGFKGASDLIYSNPVRALDSGKAKLMEDEILDGGASRDSVGGVVEAVAFNVPTGVGEPVFDKLHAVLGKALLSIPGCKAFEFGDGFRLSGMRGSQAIDEYYMEGSTVKSKTNHSGGLQGGITYGMPLVFRAGFKPTASIGLPQETVNLKDSNKEIIRIEGRHDPCIVPRAVPVVEAMAKIVLADQLMVAGKIPRKIE